MKVILKHMNNNDIKVINEINHENCFNHSQKVLSIEYDDNYKLFDKLNQDAIVLIPCKNSKDFIIEYISENYIDFINSNNKYDAEIDYTKIIGRYFTKIFPFLDNPKILKLFNDVVKTHETLEFRELKYIEDILISSYRHKIFYSNNRIFHLAYFEDDLELLYFTGEEFFDKSERPYILIEGNEILKTNGQFLKYFEIESHQIIGKFDFDRLNLIDIDSNDLKIILNNLLNRKSFFEIFEFSILDVNSNERYFRAYASPSSYDFKPAVKIFFEEISEEKKYEIESYYLQNTLDLVQNNNDIACFFKDNSIESEKELKLSPVNNFFEEDIMASNGNSESNIEYLDMEDYFEKRSKSNDIENLLNNNTIYSKGIANILELDTDSDLNNIHIIDYIDDEDKEDFLSELISFSKNYSLINTNFRIKVNSNHNNYPEEKNYSDIKQNQENNDYSDNDNSKDGNLGEKYINFILEGIFDENGELIEYNGFIKDASDSIYAENILKDKLSDMDDLLDNVSELNQELRNMRKSKEKLLKDSYDFINDLFELFIQIMDYNLENGMDKKVILENIERRINYLVKIHDYIGDDFNLESINVKNYFEDLINHLSSKFNFDYAADIDEISINIASLSYLTIIVYEFFYNIFHERNHFFFKLKNNGDNGYLIILNNYDKDDEDDSDKINNINMISNIKSREYLMRILENDGKLYLVDDSTFDNVIKDKKFISINLVKFIINSLDFDLIKDESDELFIIRFPINKSQIISFNKIK